MRDWLAQGSWTLVLVVGLVWSGLVAAQETQSLASVRDVVREYVRANLVAAGGDARVEVGNLDSRLRLRRCDQPLQAFEGRGGVRGGRTTIGVRCTGNNAWTIYVSARIREFEQVYVLDQNLPRGEALQSEHLATREMDVGTLAQGYFVDEQTVLGMRLRRSGRAGEVITSNLVDRPNLVERQQRVTIEVAIGSTQVSTQGEALEEGAEGDWIRVRNSRSGRLVEGEVVAEGRVRVPR